MLHIFGRAIRCPAPPGSRLSSTSRALARKHRQHDHQQNGHGNGEDDVAYTSEELEYLDSDALPQAGPSHQHQEEPVGRKYRHQKKIPSPDWASTWAAREDALATTSEASTSVGREIAHDHDPEADESAESDWLDSFEDEPENTPSSKRPPGESEPHTHPASPLPSPRPANRPVTKKKRKKHEWWNRPKFKDPFADYVEPKAPYEPRGFQGEYPYFALKLHVDPVGVPPSINTALYYFGFRYKDQILYRKKGGTLAARLRRIGRYLRFRHLTEEEAMELKAEKQAGIHAEVKRRHLVRKQAKALRRQEASTGEPPPRSKPRVNDATTAVKDLSLEEPEPKP